MGIYQILLLDDSLCNEDAGRGTSVLRLICSATCYLLYNTRVWIICCRDSWMIMLYLLVHRMVEKDSHNQFAYFDMALANICLFVC